jgi:hypothetical protein
MRTLKSIFAGIAIALSLSACGSSDTTPQTAASGDSLSAAIPDGTYAMTSISCNGTSKAGASVQIVSSGGNVTETVSNMNGCGFTRTGTFLHSGTNDEGQTYIVYSWQTPTGASGGCSSLSAWSSSIWTSPTNESYNATLSGSTLTLPNQQDPCSLYDANGLGESGVVVFSKQ